MASRLRKAHREKNPQEVAQLSAALKLAVAAAAAHRQDGREVKDLPKDHKLRIG
ncbi:MAG: hypothetical protein HY814_04280 [Candidatus Riflebacteria bacterium]|nr:hypothetical protein [Candidatus Riflebacteria bacterium]